MSSQISGVQHIGRSDMRPAKVFLIFATGVTLGFFVCKIYVQPYINSQKSSASVTRIAEPMENLTVGDASPVVASESATPIR